MGRSDARRKSTILLAAGSSAVLAGCVGTDMVLDSSGLTPSGGYLAGMIASDFEGANEAMARAASADPVPGSITQGSNIYTRSDTRRVNSADRIWSRAELTEDGKLDVGISNGLDDDNWSSGRWDRLRTDTADIVHDVKIAGRDGTPLYGQQLGKSFSGDVPSTVWASVWSNAEATDDGRLIAGVWAERREYGWKNEWTLGAFANGPDSSRTLEGEREQIWNQMNQESGGMRWTGRAAGILMQKAGTYEVNPFIGQVGLRASIGGDEPWIDGQLVDLHTVNLDGTDATPLTSVYTFDRASIRERDGGFFTSDVTGLHVVGGSRLDMSGRWGGELYGAVGQHVLGTFALHGETSQAAASMIGTFGAKSTHHLHTRLIDMLQGRRDDGLALLRKQVRKSVWHNGGTVSQHDGSDSLSVSVSYDNELFMSVTDTDEDGWGKMDSSGTVTLEEDAWSPGTSDREFGRQIFYKVYDHDKIAMVDARSIRIGSDIGAPHLVLGNWAELHGYPSYSNGATGSFAGAADDHRAPSSAIRNALSSGEAKYEGDAWGHYSYRYPDHDGDEATLTRMEASVTLKAKQDDDGYRIEGRLHNVKTAKAGENLKHHIWPWWIRDLDYDFDLEATHFDSEVAGGPSSGNTLGSEEHASGCIVLVGCNDTQGIASSGKWGAQFYGADAEVLAGTFGFEGGANNFRAAFTGTFVAERTD